MRTTKSKLGFASLCLLTTAVLHKVIWRTFSLAWRDEESNYILLILPISIALIVSQWKNLPDNPTKSLRIGASLLGLSALIALLSRWNLLTFDLQLSVGMLGVVISWIAAFVICFGTELARALRFPLAFLLWTVPIPSALGLEVARVWQYGSARVASFLFSVVNVPTSTDGVLLYLPGLNFEIARECSSLRSSLILIVTTMVVAHLLLRTTWRKTLIVLLAIPISIAKNGFRIFTIGLLTIKVNPSFLSGRLHREGGFIFFSIGMALVFAFLWIAIKTERQSHWFGSRPVAPETLMKA